MVQLDPYGVGGGIPDPPVDGADPYGGIPAPIRNLATVRNLSATSNRWSETNYVLGLAELGYESDTGRFKLGTGTTPWSSLEYFISQGVIVSLVTGLLSTIDLGDLILEDHVNSPHPHPVYDEGPSLFLIYQNAKV